MVVPALLMLPLIMEYQDAIDQGVDTNMALAQSVNIGTFLWGFFGTTLFGVLGSTAMMILFAAKKKVSLAVALTSAVRRYIPVLYTSFLSGLAIALAFLPAQLLNSWYMNTLSSGLVVDGSGMDALRIIIVIAVIALMIPPVIIAVWVMYAPMAVALKETTAGFTALMFAKNLTHKHAWQIVWRMIGALILFQVVSMSVSTLPIAWYAIPFILMILIVAFFVELYKEIRA
jgi:hypothetical protein